MLETVTKAALWFCAVNFIGFAVAAYLEFTKLKATIDKELAGMKTRSGAGINEAVDFDPNKAFTGIGDLAKALKEAGTASSFAALSVGGLIIALVAAGLAKLPGG